MAVVLEPGAAVRYLDIPDRQAYYVAECWEPVSTAYAELVATVSSGGKGCAA